MILKLVFGCHSQDICKNLQHYKSAIINRECTAHVPNVQLSPSICVPVPQPAMSRREGCQGYMHGAWH